MGGSAFLRYHYLPCEDSITWTPERKKHVSISKCQCFLYWQLVESELDKWSHKEASSRVHSPGVVESF